MALQVGKIGSPGSSQMLEKEGRLQPSGSLSPGFCLQFEAFCAGGLAPGWSLTVQGHADAGEDKFEINFLTDAGDIAFHVKPRFSSATVVGNAFQGGRWGQEEVSSVFPLTLGEPFEMEVSADAEHFHIYAQEQKVLQFPHRHRPLATITRVRVLSDHRLAQVELAKRSLSWGCFPPSPPVVHIWSEPAELKPEPWILAGMGATEQTDHTAYKSQPWPFCIPCHLEPRTTH
ncbi:grifin [Apodemus sylvaticus]|uniref:grifin n=1 Tax=Apodemus sylvaticus TaxID=10129 RepID=UPI002243134A|nr:grifin [Apodemus sylvaticus]